MSGPFKLKYKNSAFPFKSPAKHKLTQRVSRGENYRGNDKTFPIELAHTHPKNEKAGDRIKIGDGKHSYSVSTKGKDPS